MGKLQTRPHDAHAENSPRRWASYKLATTLVLPSSNRLLCCCGDGLSRDAEVLVERRGRA